MVQNSTGCADKNINSLSQLPDLVFNVDATIDCDNLELALVVL